jgi:oligosaccharide repeat unit polymerase
MGLYFVKAGAIPLLAPDAENFRVEAKAGLGFWTIGSLCLISSGLLMLVLRAELCKRGYLWVIGAFLLAEVVAIGMGFRGPVVTLALNVILVWLYLRKGKVPLKYLIFMGLAIFLMVGFVQFLRGTGSVTADIDTITRLAVWRIFSSVLNVLNNVYLAFPERIPFLYGNSYLIDFAVLLPGPQEHFGFWLKYALGYDFPGGGVTPTILGESYANFGWLGIIIVLPLLGFLFKILYRTLTAKEKVTPDRLVLLVILSTSLMAIPGQGIVIVVFLGALPYALAWLALLKISRLRFATLHTTGGRRYLAQNKSSLEARGNK